VTQSKKFESRPLAPAIYFPPFEGVQHKSLKSKHNGFNEVEITSRLNITNHHNSSQHLGHFWARFGHFNSDSANHCFHQVMDHPFKTEGKKKREVQKDFPLNKSL